MSLPWTRPSLQLSPHSAVSSQDRTHGPKLNTALFQHLYGLTRVPRAPRDAQGTLQGLCAQWISLSSHYVVTTAQSSHCQYTRDAGERFELRRGQGAICISFWDHWGGCVCVCLKNQHILTSKVKRVCTLTVIAPAPSAGSPKRSWARTDGRRAAAVQSPRSEASPLTA